MSEPVQNEAVQRLKKLPGQIGLALINGTAVLVIVAAMLALIATAKVTGLAEDVASTMTDAVLSKVDVKPERVMGRLEAATAEAKALRLALKEKGAAAHETRDAAIERLNERLAALELGIARLRDGREQLVKEGTARLSVSLGEMLQTYGACRLEDAGTATSTPLLQNAPSSLSEDARP